jgi:MFS family permease
VKPKFFYGWYIVAVGFLAYFASAFTLASTLSVFLKPLTQDLGVSRGVFSLLRSGEGLIGAGMAPVSGSLVDRYGARWLMTIGAIVMGMGLLLLSQVEAFWQFLLVRWSLVAVGDAFMGYMVINVAIARWFTRRRGRAVAISSMGVGFAKVCMPLVAASLLVWLGWRQTWAAFGLLTLALVVAPAVLLVRRSPEDMGLHPDGAPGAVEPLHGGSRGGSASGRETFAEDVVWTRTEAARTPTFWLIVIVFGISSVGVTGLNLHVFPYVSDIGHSEVVAATVMSGIAITQLASPLLWGLFAERIGVRQAAMMKFLVQAAGLSLAITTRHLPLLYGGFLLYGFGLGGGMVLSEIMWANYFGRLSLGKVRGMGLLLTHVLSAMGPPFFGFLFDLTHSYVLPFSIFAVLLLTSAFLSLAIVPPEKRAPPSASVAR